MRRVKLFGKSYLVDVDRLSYVLVMSILIIIFVIGTLYIHTSNFNMLYR